MPQQNRLPDQGFGRDWQPIPEVSPNGPRAQVEAAPVRAIDRCVWLIAAVAFYPLGWWCFAWYGNFYQRRAAETLGLSFMLVGAAAGLGWWLYRHVRFRLQHELRLCPACGREHRRAGPRPRSRIQCTCGQDVVFSWPRVWPFFLLAVLVGHAGFWLAFGRPLKFLPFWLSYYNAGFSILFATAVALGLHLVDWRSARVQPPERRRQQLTKRVRAGALVVAILVVAVGGFKALGQIREAKQAKDRAREQCQSMCGRFPVLAEPGYGISLSYEECMSWCSATKGFAF